MMNAGSYNVTGIDYLHELPYLILQATFTFPFPVTGSTVC